MTYLYETIPLLPGDEVKQYEIEQSMKEDALKRHPETGEPIRRIILGGWGLMTGKSAKASNPCCGPSGCC